MKFFQQKKRTGIVGYPSPGHVRHHPPSRWVEVWLFCERRRAESFWKSEVVADADGDADAAGTDGAAAVRSYSGMRWLHWCICQIFWLRWQTELFFDVERRREGSRGRIRREREKGSFWLAGMLFYSLCPDHLWGNLSDSASTSLISSSLCSPLLFSFFLSLSLSLFHHRNFFPPPLVVQTVRSWSETRLKKRLKTSRR